MLTITAILLEPSAPPASHLRLERYRPPAHDEGFAAPREPDVLGGETVREGEPSIVQLANSWIINVGGGPTVDERDVILETPPDPTRASGFLNIRVADIQAVYEDWRSRGAEFITPPKDLGREIRCYIRDPDGH